MTMADNFSDVHSISSLALAYMGDAVIELHVREALIRSGGGRPHLLHLQATHYVSAKAQSAFIHELLEEDFLTKEEERIFKRGRNAKSHSVPKNTDVQTYNCSTGFEALIGYLYLIGNQARVKQLMKKMFDNHPIERRSKE